MAKFSAMFYFFFVSNNLLMSVYSETLVPCYFIFGDSLVDNGNNNARNTIAKANYPPYGIDYPDGPTGRFTNGRNVADIIAELLGFNNHIPPFATASGDAILNGINYGSGGAGILDNTGKQFGDLISLSEQLENHKTTISRINTIIGNPDSAKQRLSQCIYSVGMGSNDYAAYALTLGPYSPEQFAAILIEQYSRQLRDLYTSGARKIAIFGVGTVGCVPAAIKGPINGTSCVSSTNDAVQIFNSKLKSLVDVLNKDLVGAKFIYIDTYRITASDPSFNGFNYKNIPCCAVSNMGVCLFEGVTCNPRTDYLYFDGFHPTEAAVAIVAKRAFRAQSPLDAYPFDIQHLAQAQ
ncbi:Triacylglycerol lipase [Handroanthus impetiginosus]|uniref:Triacylglycerol lipase n=1 Tax=Handroanthus impetiginosus TaxID=429701 RepID=A0A2G9GGE2_9LAMI|nr:Triacylglycerol lipase [Handroanthus impetiginosus]